MADVSVLEWRETYNVVTRLVRVKIVSTVKVRVCKLLKLVFAAHEFDKAGDVVLFLSAKPAH